MNAIARIERRLAETMARATARGGPPGLAAAMRHAVFPGGARIRPRLCLAVASAIGDDDPDLTEAAAAAIEILHCASLVHDDLPCFDDAAMRRGRPSVHHAFGERLAVLAGDALIVLAYETLALSVPRSPQRLPAILAILSHAAGAPFGIAAGQAWECEPEIDLAGYQRAKTGALFAAATMAGAAATGAATRAWRIVGQRLGEAYQVADDIRDTTARPEDIGKPVGQDQAHACPNAVLTLGLSAARARLRRLIDGAVEAIPPAAGRARLSALILDEMSRLMPAESVHRAA